tara:strand:+ start:189 stop:368 length:180 start_codon:yes stop_codon:yes gene_type:complete
MKIVEMVMPVVQERTELVFNGREYEDVVYEEYNTIPYEIFMEEIQEREVGWEAMEVEGL